MRIVSPPQQITHLFCLTAAFAWLFLGINECTSNPCQNGAVCKEGVNKYTCTCAAGYEGVHCENSKSTSADHTPVLLAGSICLAIF